MWARLNKRGGTHVRSGEGWKKKKTDCRRATATESTTMWCRRSSAPICDAAVAVAGAVDIVVVLLGSLARLALTVASSVGRLVCRMNECSWCQPRPITRYTTLTQCLLLLLLQWRRKRGARASLPLAAAGKRSRGAVNDTALSFLCAFLLRPRLVLWQKE